MKIAHFQVDEADSSARLRTLQRALRALPGVTGVVAVRSMGLLSVLYDEARIDAVRIADEIARRVASFGAGENGMSTM
jgi:hypothetical protein